MNQRVVLSGATGYIGRFVARAFAQAGWQVTGLARADSVRPTDAASAPSVKFVATDGSVQGLADILRHEQPALCIHLASLFIAEHKPEDVPNLVRANVEFGSCLLEAMGQTGCRHLINTGTSWQHYEDAEYNPACLYAATKEAFEAIVEYYVRVRDFRVATLTLFDTFGPGDPRPKLIPNLLRTIRQGTPLAMSPGAQQLDFVHVDDVARAFRLAAEQLLAQDAAGHTRYAVRSGQPVSLRDLVALLGRLSGCAPQIRWGERPYRQREIMHPWRGGQTVPGWQATIGLEDGLRDLLRQEGGA